jgi:hypothetical protein
MAAQTNGLPQDAQLSIQPYLAGWTGENHDEHKEHDGQLGGATSVPVTPRRVRRARRGENLSPKDRRIDDLFRRAALQEIDRLVGDAGA